MERDLCEVALENSDKTSLRVFVVYYRINAKIRQYDWHVADMQPIYTSLLHWEQTEAAKRRVLHDHLMPCVAARRRQQQCM